MSNQEKPIEEAFRKAKVRVISEAFNVISLCASTDAHSYGVYDLTCQKGYSPSFICLKRGTQFGRPLHAEELDVLIENAYRDLSREEQERIELKNLPTIFARAVNNNHFRLNEINDSEEMQVCMTMVKNNKDYYCAGLGKNGHKSFFKVNLKPMTGEEFKDFKKVAMKALKGSEKIVGYLAMFEMAFLNENRNVVKGWNNLPPPDTSHPRD